VPSSLEVPNRRLTEPVDLNERLRRTLPAARELVHSQPIGFDQVWRHTDKADMSG
jgi:hypothetical protein